MFIGKLNLISWIKSFKKHLHKFREILTNENATVNDTDGTVQYYPHREFSFQPDKSVGDPNLDYIMTTNIPLVVRLFILHLWDLFLILLWFSGTSSFYSRQRFLSKLGICFNWSIVRIETNFELNCPWLLVGLYWQAAYLC